LSAANGKTPAAQGFAMPAEWERHEATWLSFPHNAADWPGKFAPVPWAYAEIVRWAAEGETVRLIVKDAAHEKSTRRVLERSGIALDRVQLLRWPTDRGWMRDTGPIWVTRSGGRAIARFRFDGWSKYANWKKDVKLPERAAALLDAELLPVSHRERGVILEGGAIDVNGAGTLLTTEECMLDPDVQVRNPGFARADYEAVFRDALGARNTIWLGRGIAGDDTHGHVDDLARFVDPRTIVLVREDDPKDANYAPLEENRERLQGARLEDGSRPALVYLPMPGPIVFDGQRLPASYANFYVANAAVLVPTFDDPADREALGILGEVFKDRPVVGIHARDLVWGLGTIHCLSQQEPAVPL
jgi:agmatine deiminase